MKLPQYKNDAPLYSKPADPPFESVKFVSMFFGYPAAFVVCVIVVLVALFN